MRVFENGNQYLIQGAGTVNNMSQMDGMGFLLAQLFSGNRNKGRIGKGNGVLTRQSEYGNRPGACRCSQSHYGVVVHGFFFYKNIVKYMIRHAFEENSL